MLHIHSLCRPEILCVCWWECTSIICESECSREISFEVSGPPKNSNWIRAVQYFLQPFAVVLRRAALASIVLGNRPENWVWKVCPQCSRWYFYLLQNLVVLWLEKKKMKMRMVSHKRNSCGSGSGTGVLWRSTAVVCCRCTTRKRKEKERQRWGPGGPPSACHSNCLKMESDLLDLIEDLWISIYRNCLFTSFEYTLDICTDQYLTPEDHKAGWTMWQIILSIATHRLLHTAPGWAPIPDWPCKCELLALTQWNQFVKAVLLFTFPPKNMAVNALRLLGLHRAVMGRSRMSCTPRH